MGVEESGLAYFKVHSQHHDGLRKTTVNLSYNQLLDEDEFKRFKEENFANNCRQIKYNQVKRDRPTPRMIRDCARVNHDTNKYIRKELEMKSVRREL
jgi:hypothetical protein